jgi:hypothetical protein
MSEVFDLLVLTIPRDLPVLAIGMPYMRSFLAPRRTIFAASHSCLEALMDAGIASEGDSLLDEDSLCPGLSLSVVEAMLRARGIGSQRAGWYLKQMLNFAYAMREDAPAHYLTWDADTIPLKPIPFFDASGRTILERKTEYHEPYFSTLRRLLGIDRQVDYSFIAEHMMFDKDIVRALVHDAMAGKEFDGRAFAQRILGSVDDKDLSTMGFAEYETYGHFATARFVERITTRDLPSSRRGSTYFRRPPKAFQLYAMSRKYSWASFESWAFRGSRLAKLFVGRTMGFAWAAGVTAIHPLSCARFARIGQAKAAQC